MISPIRVIDDQSSCRWRLVEQSNEYFIQYFRTGVWIRYNHPRYEFTCDADAIEEFREWLRWREGSAAPIERKPVPAIKFYETEKDFQQAIVDLAHTLGWKVYHTWNSKHSEAGDLDLRCRRERLFFAELKMPGRKPTQAQWDEIAWLKAHGFEVYLWYPDDWPEIEETLKRKAETPPNSRCVEPDPHQAVCVGGERGTL